MSPTNPIQIDFINITNQKRERGEKHKIQFPKIDKASLGVSGFVLAIRLFFTDTRAN